MASVDNSSIKASLKQSPSLLYNNLAAIGKGLAYSHKQQVVAISSVPTTTGAPADCRKVHVQDASPVHSIRHSTLQDQNLLVIATCDGLQVWDATASSLLFFWKLPEQPAQSRHADFARGSASHVAADGSSQLCVGSSSGSVYVFAYSDGPSFQLSATLQHHTAPITALSSAHQSRRGGWTEDLTCELVSADEAGGVAVWEALDAGSYSLKRKLGSSTAPCCGLAVRKGFVICGRADGTIQLYGLHNGELRTEIVAHSRFMSSMDIHPVNDWLVTTAEDATLAVWQLPIGGEQASVLLSSCWLHALITGAAFCGPDSNDVAAVAFDTDEVRVWKDLARTH